MFGKTETYKIVYVPTYDKINANNRDVALIEAASQMEATLAFREQYAGQYSTIDYVEKIG